MRGGAERRGTSRRRTRRARTRERARACLAVQLAEAVRGRPLGQTAQEYGFRFGLILVMLLVVFVTWNDLVHLRVIEFLKELFV